MLSGLGCVCRVESEMVKRGGLLKLRGGRRGGRRGGVIFFLMVRGPPGVKTGGSSAELEVYKEQ